MSTTIVAYPEATTFLYSKLTSPAISGVSGVYEDAAPEQVTTAADTWIEFELMSPGTDEAEIGEQRIWTEFAFLIRAIGRGRSTVALRPMAQAIDDRLHRKNGTTSLGQVISAVRTQEDQGHWLEQGVEFRSLGGVYNLIVQSLNP